MKKILTLLAAVMTFLGLSAENYFLKSTWGQSEATWKQMIEDDGSYIFEGDVFFDGNDIAINTVASDEGARIIKVENIDATINYVEKAELAAGDSVFFVYVPDMYNQYNEKESGLMAMINWKNGYAIKYDAAWKNMAKDDETFVLFNAAYAGKDVQIVNGKNIRAIKAENINTMLNYDAAELAAGDSVMYIYDPESYSQYDEKASGLIAMINWKNGYAILQNGAWKNMIEDDGTFSTYATVAVDGKNVQVVNGNNIQSIEMKNIQALLNFDEAELAAGDSVMYVYDPEGYSAYDETKSGLIAIINWKNGYAIKYDAAWKNMAKDDETFVLFNAAYAGKDVQIVSGNQIRAIKAENINSMLNYDAAELAAGDSVMYIYDPEAYSQYDEKASGLIAMINWKNGYAILQNGAWKNMIEDEGTFSTYATVAVDGKAVQVVKGNNIQSIEMKNIQALLNFDEAELAAGDSVMYVYDPEGYSAYDETKSGLIAIINWKNGYAIKYDAAWKNMAKDDATFVLFNGAFAGKAVQIVSGNQIRAIKAENINAMLNYDAAELAAGDSVMYVYDPEAYSQYDEKQSGLFAMITWKNGYAILENGTWKNMIDDDPEDHDWWIFEKTEFNGKAVQIVTENQIRAIEPKNIEAYINYAAAELSAGDTVMYVYRPSLYNRYDETQSGMYAHILAKNGYAMLGTWGEQFASWKNMILDAAQEDETYVLDSVIFDGNDVQFISNEGIRVIKVANIPALLMEDYSEATLEEGDLVMFVYTPDTYSHYDETKSGLMALIYEKNQGEGFESIAIEGKAVKVIVNGQMMIIKNGQMYNATGALVK